MYLAHHPGTFAYTNALHKPPWKDKALSSEFAVDCKPKGDHSWSNWSIIMVLEVCVVICRGLVAGGAQAAMSGVSSGGASNSGSASFLAYTPNSTLAITAASTTPHSASGSVAGPLALTPVRRMDLPQQGTPFMLCRASWGLTHLSCRT